MIRKTIEAVENRLPAPARPIFREYAYYIAVYVYSLLKFVALVLVFLWIYKKVGFDRTVIIILLIIVNILYLHIVKEQWKELKP